MQRGLPSDVTLLREDPLDLPDSQPEPDLAIVRGEERDFVHRHPTTAALVVEIAVSSAAEDRSLATLYAEAGVEEYWIVLPLERRIEVYRRPDGRVYRESSGGGSGHAGLWECARGLCGAWRAI